MCHWTLVVCDAGVTRDVLANLVISGIPSDPFRLGLLFELNRTTKSHYELKSMPGFTAKEFVHEFPVCSVYFAGITQRSETDIINIGTSLAAKPPLRMFGLLKETGLRKNIQAIMCLLTIVRTGRGTW